MAIPDYQSLMLPLLNTIADGKEDVFRANVEQRATLMVEHDVGVARIGSYVLKRLDNDYFDLA